MDRRDIIFAAIKKSDCKKCALALAINAGLGYNKYDYIYALIKNIR